VLRDLIASLKAVLEQAMTALPARADATRVLRLQTSGSMNSAGACLCNISLDAKPVSAVEELNA
jgi:hypothetical protein